MYAPPIASAAFNAVSRPAAAPRPIILDALRATPIGRISCKLSRTSTLIAPVGFSQPEVTAVINLFPIPSAFETSLMIFCSCCLLSKVSISLPKSLAALPASTKTLFGLATLIAAKKPPKDSPCSPKACAKLDNPVCTTLPVAFSNLVTALPSNVSGRFISPPLITTPVNGSPTTSSFQ